MPSKRQQPDPESRISVRSLGLGLPDGHRLQAHRHPWHQLVYGSTGVMTVKTPVGAWVVPPQRAVWIPANQRHSIGSTGWVRMRTLYLLPKPTDKARGLPADCCVMNVAPLLRELILEIVGCGMLHDDIPEQANLQAVLLDQIGRSPEAPLVLKLPKDLRARRVARKVQTKPQSNLPIEVLAQSSGASARTIERLFLRQTGLTFGRWRQRVRVLAALQRLALGDSVTECGQALGYDSTSAFISMFKRVLGTTPGAYFASATKPKPLP